MVDTWTYLDEPPTLACTLPGGEAAAVRPLTGREEEFIAERSSQATLPVLVTHLLARCVQHLGGATPVTPDRVRRLLVADRDYLLLKLRQATFGNRVQAVLGCPQCGQNMDLDFELDQIGVVSRRPPPAPWSFELPETAAYTDAAGKTHRRVESRLPTGEDLEAIAARAELDAAGAQTALLARCVLRVGEIAPVTEALAAAWPAAMRAEIEAQLERVAPQVEWELEIHCPECGQMFEQVFNFPAFFLAEVRARRDRLYREVHFLALHYHWPEAEILALPRAKRQTYLGLLQEMAPGAVGGET